MSRTYHHHHRRMRWSGPNWLNHMYGTKPIRAKSNQIVKKMKMLVDLEDAPLMPHAKHNKRGYWY